MTEEANMDEKVERAVRALREGCFVVVSDAADREDEADLVLAAEHATADRLAFLVRHTSGIVCAPMSRERAERLGLPPMVEPGRNTEPHGTAFTVSVDAAAGTSTGISAADRAVTLRALADPAATPADFVRPGHVFPLRAHPDGLRGRGGHTEASVELLRLAGLTPVAVICELVADDGEMLGHEGVQRFAAEAGLHRLDVAEIAAAAEAVPPTRVRELAVAPLPTRHGDFSARLLRTAPDGLEHLVLTLGDLTAPPVLVRIHSECATGDLFGSRRCDCGEQLDASLQEIRRAGRGVVVYERGHEGRGIGLADKLRAYALQDAGADTIDANLWLGHPADARDFAPAARVLAHLGVRDLILLTNNPDKIAAARAEGLSVTARSLRTPPHAANVRYLETKRVRCGHDLTAVAGDAAAG
jgi:3,4-dihydroxy 2-butanone 4-phosphate synthase/GTP cyclohydrolase II